MLKVYIAASMHTQAQVRQCAEELSANNIECTSRWVDCRPVYADTPMQEKADIAVRDLEDIDKAHVVVLLSDIKSSTGGLWCEMGYCLAQKKPLIAAGAPNGNPFVYLNEVRRVSDWNGALHLLKQIAVILSDSQKATPDFLSNLDSALIINESIAHAVLNAPF